MDIAFQKRSVAQLWRKGELVRVLRLVTGRTWSRPWLWSSPRALGHSRKLYIRTGTVPYECTGEKLTICTGKKLYEWLIRVLLRCGILSLEACERADTGLAIEPDHNPACYLIHCTKRRASCFLGVRDISPQASFLLLSLCAFHSSIRYSGSCSSGGNRCRC